MDPKVTWPVVKFLIAATGFGRSQARHMLQEIPPDLYSRLFMEALTWDRETSGQASKALRDMLGVQRLDALQSATIRAQKPATADRDDEDEPPARPHKRPQLRAR